MSIKNPGLDWIKSSSSVGTGACVELARDGDMIALRDSKHPDITPFQYTDREIEAFLGGAKRGEFDHPLHHSAAVRPESTVGS